MVVRHHSDRGSTAGRGESDTTSEKNGLWGEGAQRKTFFGFYAEVPESSIYAFQGATTSSLLVINGGTLNSKSLDMIHEKEEIMRRQEGSHLKTALEKGETPGTMKASTLVSMSPRRTQAVFIVDARVMLLTPGGKK